jgi:hypothetical protein
MPLAADNAPLRVEHAARRQLVEHLQEQLAAAPQRIAALEPRADDPPPCGKPNRPHPPPPTRPRQNWAPHPKRARRREEPTRGVRQALARWPDGHDQWRGTSRADARQGIARPAPQPGAVSDHQVIKRWGPVCLRWRPPQLDRTGQGLGPGRLGGRRARLLAELRPPVRLPRRRSQRDVQTIQPVRSSAGAVVELLQHGPRAPQGSVAERRAPARARPVRPAAETGWREAGPNGSIWRCRTPGAAGVRDDADDRRRGRGGGTRSLGGQVTGHWVSAFLRSDTSSAGTQQRGWGQLLRPLHELQAQPAQAAPSVAGAEAGRPLDAAAQRGRPGSAPLRLAQREAP